MTDKQKIKVLKQLIAFGPDMFVVRFKRRTDKVVKGKVIAKAGTIRKMIAQLKPDTVTRPPSELRQGEDFRTGCLTVLDIESDQFKRIPLDGIVSIKKFKGGR